MLDENDDPVLDLDGAPRIITIPQEKGIDVRLALDLVSAARKKQFDNVVECADDTALEDAPEAFNRVGMHCANDLLALGVVVTC
jgi:uncharacterized LabA/DUF88 family protein